MKWYDEKISEDSVIISSRIRLARNLKNYPFSITINNEQSRNLTNEIKHLFENELCKEFEYINFDEKSDLEKLVYFENHAISQTFLKTNREKALLLREDDKVSIMINEEDHIRLQTIFSGDNLDEALALANKVDDLIENNVDYAFDKNLGYLTTCPTNVGTGLRASYMIHIPMLSYSPQLPILINSIGKFGMTIRGIFGEGTSPAGSIFQISNQITIGRKEEEIIKSLQTITKQIIDNENILTKRVLELKKIDWEDRVNRSYGILQNARKISLNEAMKLLSDVRIGFMNQLINKQKHNIYNIMMQIRSAHLQANENRKLTEEERDILRANYLRNIFGEKSNYTNS